MFIRLQLFLPHPRGRHSLYTHFQFHHRADTMWTTWVDRNSGAFFYHWYLLIRQYRTICWGGNFKSDSLCSYCNILPSRNSAIIIDWVASLVRVKKKSLERREDTFEITISSCILKSNYRPWNCPMFQDCQIVSLNV